MSQTDTAHAVNGLRDVVLKDPELLEIARKATSLAQNLSPRAAYLTALGAALKPELLGRFIPCI